MQSGENIICLLFIIITFIAAIILWRNSGKMENYENSIREKDIKFMQFAFGEDYIKRTKLEALAYWNEKYGHDLKIDENEIIPYSLEKMFEYYKKCNPNVN